MKKAIVIVILFLLLAGCGSDVPEPRECALCDTFPRHGLCLMDMNSGKLHELEIYQPHYTKVAEISDEQHGGYLSLIRFGDINGILIGADRVELEAPVNDSGMVEEFFCTDCRKLLKDNLCQGYILADPRNPKTPSVWEIADGISFSVRCYNVRISKEDVSGQVNIQITGTLNADG